jgi:excisionase family DNA binding protein
MESSTRPTRLLTVPEAARFLGLSINTVYVRCRAGEIPHLRLSAGTIRFDLDALKAWLEANSHGPKVAVS